MMKMMVRVQKRQVTDFYKYDIPGQFAYFYKNPAIQAGFTQFDVMAVGASGGSNFSLYEQYRGAGGGGGGSFRQRGSLNSLPDSIHLGVGTKGPDMAGAAYNGSASWFHNWVAYGGGGASSVEKTQAGHKGSNGGGGGGNSLGLGTPGVGGHSRSENYGNNLPRQGPSEGTYVDQGNGNGGGCGGGGGAGRSGRNGYESEPTGGANGNMVAVGGAGGPVVSGHYGGYGGGANVVSVTGSNEQYGSGNHGIVTFRLS